MGLNNIDRSTKSTHSNKSISSMNTSTQSKKICNAFLCFIKLENTFVLSYLFFSFFDKSVRSPFTSSEVSTAQLKMSFRRFSNDERIKKYFCKSLFESISVMKTNTRGKEKKGGVAS